jgi:ribonucleoside-diphosphate reductase alpha chain
VALAVEKNCFPAFRAEPYLAAPFIRALPQDLRDAIARHGIRNSHLLAIAPTGSISLLAGDLSSGVEPVFAPILSRTVLDAFGTPHQIEVIDHAYRLWRRAHGALPFLTPAWVTAAELSAEAHLSMLAALQPHIDNAISKTINLPEGASFEDFSGVFFRAHALGLKGCTIYRAGLPATFKTAPASG